MGRPLAVTSFTTDAYSPRDRHEAWRARDWPTIGPVFETCARPDFHNHAKSFTLGGIVVHVSEMAGQRYERSAGQARRDGLDQLIVALPLSGSQIGDSAGMTVANAPGRMVVTDLARPHAHESTDSAMVMLTVPRDTLTGGARSVDRLHGFAAEGSAVAILRDHVAAIARHVHLLDADAAPALARSVGLLLDLALAEPGEEPREPVRRAEALLLRAQAAIDRDLASPALDVAALCRTLNVSRSVLYRVFEERGGVAAVIRARRLEAARRALLADPAAPIAGVARAVGFGDAAHFSRAFRAAYGVSPRGVRRGEGGDT